MENAIDNTTSTATPQEEVDSLIQMVADEHGLALNEGFDNIGIGTSQPEAAKQQEADPAEDIEARLAALRK